MCGIAGVIMRNGRRAERDLLERMAKALQHRGPDDHGLYQAGPVGLTQTRLSIIGLDSGHQPMVSADGALALAANGEIYNYRELNAVLQQQGRRLQTESDSETILHVYDEQGADGLDKLRGMFAFAIHDSRRQELVLVRDRLGIKPLFFLRQSDRILFASEIKAILAVLGRTPEVDAGALRQFLHHQFADGERTIINGIERVLPGELIRIDADLGIERQRWWSALNAPLPGLDFDEARRELDGLMHETIDIHMRADVPFGLFLSGGVDSAILAALLWEHRAGRIQSFSIGYSGTTMKDELDEAERVAKHFGFEHQAIRVDLPRLFGRLPHTVWAADELMRDYASLPTDLLAEAAASSLKVVFSGEGGDEAFAGYRRYRPPPIERWTKGLLAPGSGGFRTRARLRRRWMRELYGERLRAVPAPDRAAFVAAWQQTPRTWSDLQRRQYVDLTTALPDNLLVKTDRFLMAHGLEGRVPFCDHRVMEFGLGLPDALKTRGREGKWLLKRWAEPRLPPGHLDRPKRGFHVPVGDWLRGPVLEGLAERLPRNQGVKEWFQADAIAPLVNACRQGKGGTRELWCLLQFAIWHRLFIEGSGARPPLDTDPLEWI